MLVGARPRSGAARRGRRGGSIAGFTLTELLTVLTIVGVLVAFGLPNLVSFIAGQRVKTAAYDLYSTLMLARSEAVKRNADVVVAQAAGGWTNGWTVTAGGATLLTQPAYSSLTVTGSASSLTYRFNGRTSATAVQTFLVSSPNASSVDGNRCLTISLSGMPTTKLGSCS